MRENNIMLPSRVIGKGVIYQDSAFQNDSSEEEISSSNEEEEVKDLMLKWYNIFDPELESESATDSFTSYRPIRLSTISERTEPGSLSLIEPESLTPIDPESCLSTQVPADNSENVNESDKALVWKFLDVAVRQILKKVYVSPVHYKAIKADLFQRTWIIIKDVNFDPPRKAFEEIDFTISEELCEKFADAKLDLLSFKSSEFWELAKRNSITSAIKSNSVSWFVKISPPQAEDPKPLSPAQTPFVSLKKVVASAIPGAVFDQEDPEPISPAQTPGYSFKKVVDSAIPCAVFKQVDPEPISPAQTPGYSFKKVVASAIPGAVFDQEDPEPISPAQTPVYSFKKVVASAIPGAVFDQIEPEPLSPAQTPVYRVENAKNKTLIKLFMKTLVSRIFRKAKVDRTTLNYTAITIDLFERTWIEVKDIDFKPNPETLKKLDTAIFQKLCDKWGNAATLLLSIQSGEPAIGDCIASSVKDHLITPPKKGNAICRFFSSVGRSISKFFNRKVSPDGV